MDMSTLSHEDLVRELLSPHVHAVSEGPRRAKRARPIPGPMAPPETVTYKLRVARELLLRELRAQMKCGPIMESPEIVRDWLCLYCAGLEHEVFLVLYLKANQALIDVVQLFRGTLTQTSVYPRELVKDALAHNAASIVFCHNHPSGNTEPSLADEYLSQTLGAALALVDVRVLDHFIVAGDQVLSLTEGDLL